MKGYKDKHHHTQKLIITKENEAQTTTHTMVRESIFEEIISDLSLEEDRVKHSKIMARRSDAEEVRAGPKDLK